MLALSAIALAALLRSVAATLYCQCENPSYDRIFPGINEICSQLSDDWCSTNCSFASRSNCDYCQYTPKGFGPDADYARLKNWCGKQQGSSGGVPYHGRDVFCYSYDNKARCATCGGCSYENNGYRKLRARDVVDECPVGADPDECTDRAAPDAWVTFEAKNILGHIDESDDCGPIYPAAAQHIAAAFTGVSGCKVTTNQGSANDLLVTCTSLLGDPGHNSNNLHTFQSGCASAGGLEFDDNNGLIERSVGNGDGDLVKLWLVHEDGSKIRMA
ncbi:hypothetical protein V8F33_012471 [Rhypophila sp. PSN 637]